MINQNLKLKQAVELIGKATHLVAFTGAGISAESGIPPFRGEGGIWNQYDPKVLDINFFFNEPEESWQAIRELFYGVFAEALPNPAHRILAEWTNSGLLKSLITQNIDQLHQNAGNEDVICFHGSAQHLLCMSCFTKIKFDASLLKDIPPRCPSCSGLLKPDFIFFGEGIPQQAYRDSIEAAEQSDVFVIIGTSGEVSPANQIPEIAKYKGASIIEINRGPSHYTHRLSTLYLEGEAGKILPEINSMI